VSHHAALSFVGTEAFVGTERLSEGGDFRGKIAQAKSGASLGVIRLEDWLGLRPVSS